MNYIPRILTSFLLCLVIVPAALSQGMDRIAREQFKEMLSNIKNTIKKNYYDPTFHGIDLDARFKKAEDRLNEVTTPGQANAVIAQVLVDFNDSHLRYAPPRMTIDVAYGFRLQMIGDKAFITGVKPKSDADTKGLKPGDQILAFEGFKPNRREMWKVVYLYYSLSPRTKIKLNVLKPGASEPIDVEVVAKVKHRNRVVDLDNPIDLS